jgi:xanthine dehydrogenase/oxidase
MPGIRAPVGLPLKHSTAIPQTTGEAFYVADVEPPKGCLEAAMVVSEHANARIISVDASQALALPGVHGYFDHRDLASRSIKGKQRVEDDKDRVFAEGLANCVGMAIGIVVAESHAIAKDAAKLVKIKYEVLSPVLSISEAVRRSHFHKYSHCIESGNVPRALSEAPHRLTGGLRVGAQEHFYMEPHALLAIPGETFGEMEIVSCTQCVTKSAKCVAGVLGVPEAKVRVTVKRLGGGFGGKETLTIYRSGAIAVAAAKTKRAVRLVMSREEDMAISGQSHPMDGSWEVGFDSSGRILGCDVSLTVDAGHTKCCSDVVMDRAQAHFCNAYSFGSFRSEGKLAWTHLPSNTAFRGFGVPQGALICEDMMDKVASYLKMDAEAVREANFMKHQGVTPYGQNVGECHTERIWRELKASAEFDDRRASVASFNDSNRWRKRGLAIIPTQYGVNFPVKYLNQASSHVLLYTDGTVLVTHAGVEMGQGLNIKVMQVAARALDIPVDHVHISECASDRSHNASPTAASMGSDLNGMATLNACEIIMSRLRPVLEEFPDMTFPEVCLIAYKRQICLGAHGFYASPYGGVHKWRETGEEGGDNEGRGDIFNYFAFGASVAEVEIEVLTGLFEVRRADVLMDVGESLNAAIDVGQVEGAFVQGMGRWTMEEIRFDENGKMITTCPHSYHIPSAADVPKDFRVTLLGDSGTKHKTAVHSSKAVGEPPFFLSSSVYFAIKRAVEAARKEEDGGGGKEDDKKKVTEHVRIDAPLTAAKIRAACRPA